MENTENEKNVTPAEPVVERKKPGPKPKSAQPAEEKVAETPVHNAAEGENAIETPVEEVVEETSVAEESPAEAAEEPETASEESSENDPVEDVAPAEEVEEEAQEELLEEEDNSDNEDIKELGEEHHGILTTQHKYAPGDKVWVAKFTQERDSKGFSQLINSFRFSPMQGEIEKIMITDKVRYKLKNVAGSNIDEEDVCWTQQECVELCKKKNSRI